MEGGQMTEPKKDRLTPEEIMAIPACAGMDRETAQAFSETLAVFAQIVLNCVAREKAAKDCQCKVIQLCTDEWGDEKAKAA